MDNYEIYEYLRSNLKINLRNTSTGSTCGGEVAGTLSVEAELLLRNPFTDKYEIISDSKVDLE